MAARSRSAVHIEDKPAVGIDVRPEQRREGAAVFVSHPLGSPGLGEDLLEQQGVEVDQGRLEQVQREHRNLPVLLVGAGRYRQG